ncbi:MAG TPA: tetratricopeptide repeat protein [Povalibacter sp.]
MSSRGSMTFDEIVREAEALGPRERLAFLREACGADGTLFERAFDRLRASSPDWWDLEFDAEGAPGDDDSTDYVGQTIGPYRVVRTLGLGGMGEVVLAERADDQFRQRVAIKLVKRGLISRHVRGRLKIERQILASLNHPNIAKLLDGGVTTDGTPYIVMEYVEGEPIDLYCDRHRLTTNERLRLLQTVCSAVHSAHRNLVVHRDLKPSNILVSSDGIPKLLDFGIAKLLDSRESMHTVAVTQADVRLMTPDHASPEQILGLPVTTSSDIYVLGVLLYELLTGYRPFDFSNKTLRNLEKLICEQPPVPPSLAIAASRTADKEGEIASLAERRSTSVARWIRDMRGDLDNIVLMAMRKEPERRYASVEQFATDIERYLGGMPVIARRDTWNYRATKFVRRHALAVGLSAAMVVMLIGFSITTAVQSRRIERERDAVAAQHARAESERDRAESVSSFLMSAFQVSDPSESRGNEIKAREILDQGARRIDAELHGQPATQAVMLDTIGRVYFNMGLLSEAQPLLERALVIRGPLLGKNHPDVAASLVSLAQLRRELGAYDEAATQLDRALEINRLAYGASSPQVAETLHEQGRLYYAMGRLDDAEKALQESLSIYSQAAGTRALQITPVMTDLAIVMQARNDYSGAERLYRAALEKDRLELDEEHPQYAVHLVYLAAVTQAQGRIDEAEELFVQAIALLRRVYGDKHPETIDALSSLGTLQQEKKDYDGAEKSFRTALELDRALRGEKHSYVGIDLMQLGALAIARGRFTEAEKYMRESLEIFRASLPPGHPYIATGVANLGRALLELNRLDEAESTLREALKLEIAAFGADNENVAIARVSLARVLAARKRPAEAEPLFRQAYEVLFRERGAASPRTAQTRAWIADFYRDLGRESEAREFFAAIERPSQSSQVAR